MQMYLDLMMEFLLHPPMWFIVMISIIGFITIVAQMALFEKCNQQWWAALVPVYNIIVFLRILGRPSWQILYLLIPVVNIYFAFLYLIEICKCLGQNKTSDFILVCLLNGLYVFHLAMTPTIKYKGPIYTK